MDTASLTMDELLHENSWVDALMPFFPVELWHLLRHISPSEEIMEFYRTAREHGYVMVEQLVDDLRNGTYSFSSEVVGNAIMNPAGIDDAIADAIQRNQSGRVTEGAMHVFYAALQAYKVARDNACMQLNSVMEPASRLGMGVYDYIHRN